MTELVFRLPGEWYQLPVDEPEVAAQRIRLYVERVVGSGDERAPLRSLMNERLRAGLASLGGDARAVFMCRRLTAKTPMPVVMTVFSAPRLRVAPSIGTSPEAVIAALRRGLEEIGEAGIDEAVEIELPEIRALRVFHFEEKAVVEGLPDITQRQLLADYWFTKPGTKDLVWVNFFTPMGDIPTIMLSFFDSIAKLARYAEEPVSAEA